MVLCRSPGGSDQARRNGPIERPAIAIALGVLSSVSGCGTVSSVERWGALSLPERSISRWCSCSAAAFAGLLRDGSRPRFRLADGLILAYAVMSAAWILHPNVPSTLTGLEGFRKAAFPIAAYVLMRAAWVTDARPLVRVFIVGSLPAFLFSGSASTSSRCR